MCDCEPLDLQKLYKIKEEYEHRFEFFTKYVDSLCYEELNRTDIIEIQLRCDKIESLLCKQYEDVQFQIHLRDSHENDNELEVEYYKTLAIARDLVHEYNNNLTESRSNENPTKPTTPKALQFPVIQLPKFDGDSNKWLDFREAFTYLIHCNYLIDDMEKFRYLRASTDGSAAVLLKSVEFSRTNYTVAWKLLNDTYNNTNKLVQCHLSALFKIEVIKFSSKALKGFIDQLDKNLRALELLGQPVKHWDTLLLHLLSLKLNQINRSEWEKYSSKEDSTMTVDAFLQFLRIRAGFMENSERLTDQE